MCTDLALLEGFSGLGQVLSAEPLSEETCFVCGENT